MTEAGLITACLKQDRTAQKTLYDGYKDAMFTTAYRMMGDFEQAEDVLQEAFVKKDPDDNKYPDCAIAAQADYIITHDKHFKILKIINFPKVVCVSMDEFKVIFEDFIQAD